MHRLGVDIRKLERVDQTCGGLNLNGPEYPDYYYYTNEAPDNRRNNQPSVNYEYYDYHDSGAAAAGASVDVDPSPQSNQQGWVPVQNPSAQHQTTKFDDYQESASGSAGPQYVEMQRFDEPVEHQPEYHHPQDVQRPPQSPHKINLKRPGNNRRAGGPNRRVFSQRESEKVISMGQSLATKLWRVL